MYFQPPTCSTVICILAKFLGWSKCILKFKMQCSQSVSQTWTCWRLTWELVKTQKHRFLSVFGVRTLKIILSLDTCSIAWMIPGAITFQVLLSFGWLNSVTVRYGTTNCRNFYQGRKMEFTPVPHLFIEKLPCRGLRLMENCSVATRRRENLFLYIKINRTRE